MENLSEIISRYKQGDSTAAEIILERFRPLENRYLHLIRAGVGSYGDGAKFFLHAIHHPRGVAGAVGWLIFRAKTYSELELREEIRISILECCYEKPYFYGYFPYLLAKNLRELFGGFENLLPLEEGQLRGESDISWGLWGLSPEERGLLESYLNVGGDAKACSIATGLHIRTLYRRLRGISEKLLSH